MLTRIFAQLLSSIGVVFRTIRAYFMRGIVGVGARIKRFTSASRYAAKAVPKAMSSVAVAGNKPTKKEDYIETNQLFIAKSLLVIVIAGIIIAALLIYFFVFPWIQSRWLTAHLFVENTRVETYNGKVVLYYDKKKDNPQFKGRLTDGTAQGYGQYFDENGLAVFSGELVDGVYNGRGQTFADGALIYDGVFVDGLYEDGHGKLYGEGGMIYDGAFRAGLYDGYGKLYEGDVNIYKGEFSEGKRNGIGTEYFPDGSEKFTGGFANDLYDGDGALYSFAPHTVLYRGSFKSGEYDGAGSLYSGAVRYDAEFAAGEPVGGVKVYVSSRLAYDGRTASTQSGEIVPDGYGRLYDIDTGKLLFAGEFLDGKIDLASLIGMSPDAVREAFAEAVIVINEDRGAATFTYLNAQLGVAVSFPFRVEDEDPAAFGAYRLAGTSEVFGAETAIIGTAEYEVSLELSGNAPLRINTGLSPTNHLPLSSIVGITGTSYVFDNAVFTIWSDKREVAVLNTYEVDFTRAVSADSDGDAALGARVDALMSSLGMISGADTASGGNAVASANSNYGKGKTTEILLAEDLTTEVLYSVFGAMIDYLENAEACEAYEQQLSIRRARRERIASGVSVGSGTRDALERLDAEITVLESRIELCMLAMGRARVFVEYETGKSLQNYNLQEALFFANPSAFDLDGLHKAAVDSGSADEMTVKLSIIDIEMSYRELENARTSYEDLERELARITERFETGRATIEESDSARIALLNSHIALYNAMCNYSRRMYSLTELTGGKLAVDFKHYPDIFRPAPVAATVEPVDEPAEAEAEPVEDEQNADSEAAPEENEYETEVEVVG